MKIHTANSHSKKAASLLKKLVLGGLLGVMTSSSASALTIRVDKPTRNYENYGSGHVSMALAPFSAEIITITELRVASALIADGWFSLATLYGM